MWSAERLVHGVENPVAWLDGATGKRGATVRNVLRYVLCTSISPIVCLQIERETVNKPHRPTMIEYLHKPHSTPLSKMFVYTFSPVHAHNDQILT